MSLIESLAAARNAHPSAVMIGTFDGVHLGHRHIIAEAIRRAHQHGARTIALTFHPRPAEVLRPGTPSLYLCTLDERIQLLRQAGLDLVIPVQFTREIAVMSASDFVTVLVRTLNLRDIVGGPDMAVGRGREGTPDALRVLGAQMGFDVVTVPELLIDGEIVRSSAIKEALAHGDVEKAAGFLGRSYTVRGIVVRGDGRGRTIGVPTANISTAAQIILPGSGVYAVYFSHAGQRLVGAANVGTRPTFDGINRTLEVHILDFDEDIYDQECTVEFVTRLRSEQRFNGVESLLAQIADDVRMTRAILTRQGGED